MFENRSVFEIARGIRALFVNGEAGIARSGAREPGPRPSAAKVSDVSGRTDARVRRLERAGRRITRKGWEFGAKVRRLVGETGGIRAENIVWIFGIGRTGSTWLARMMGELEGHAVWFEPWVGALFDPDHLRLEKRKGKHFILAPQYRSTWLGSIRSFVLDGVRVRFPEVSGPDNYLVIKEPGGSMGAPLLMEALPESRMILLVRDPRDVAASSINATRAGGWQYESREERSPQSPVDGDPNAFVKAWSDGYLNKVGSAKRAYDAHEGRKVLVRYEDLRADTLGTMRRVYSELGIPVGEAELARAVEKHSWEGIPEEEKGEGRFYRKAAPGSWREDLTPEQARIVEQITAPLLKELYPSSS